MNATPTVASRVPFARKAENEKFANDGSLESVDLLLKKISVKCHKRVLALGLPMDFDDVLQEMRLSYVKARAKWVPEGGAMFNTYCTVVCLNNFNLAIKKMERDRVQMGMVPIEAFQAGPEFSEGESDDPYKYLAVSASPPTDSPDFRLQSLQLMQAKIAVLSSGARRLVGLLLAHEQNSTGASPRLRELARTAQIEGPELKRVKIEILNTFGVSWQ